MEKKKIFISKLVVLFGFLLFALVIINSNTNCKNSISNGLNTSFIYKPFHSNNSSIATRNDGPIQLNMQLNNEYYYGDAEKDEIYLYLDLEADRIDYENERTPLNISLVIDKSGSMSDYNKLEYVKESANYMIDELNMKDYVSIITYNDYVDILQSTTNVRKKSTLRDKISKITSGGYTNLSGGMLEGFDQVEYAYTKGYVNRVFLLSDGLANRGITNQYRLQQIVKEKNWEDGIVISTFGVGNDFNEDLMSNIAEYGRGNYYFINSPSNISRIFAQELRGIRALAGQNTKVEITFPDEYLKLKKVYGYPYEVVDGKIIIDFKDVFSSEKKSVLLKFDVVSQMRKYVNFHAELIYEDVSRDFKRIKDHQYKTLKPTNSSSEYSESFNQEVMQNVAMFEANEIMGRAIRYADDGDYENAKKQLRAGQEYLDEQKESVGTNEDIERQYESMNRYGDDLDNAEYMTEEEKKVMQKTGKYDNYKSKKKKDDGGN